MNKCENCQKEMVSSSIPWLFSCTSCKLLSSKLADEKHNGSNPLGWTESAVGFLEQLRFNNAHTILKNLSSHTTLKNKKAMDIGCAAGWFMTIAKEYGIDIIGIEPDKKIATQGQRKGLNIKNTMFPDKSLEKEKVDIITFNDVFEHIPESNKTLQSVYKQLISKGFLIINLPNSNGLFYSMARIMACLGFSAPLERLWQKGYASPHLHYFSHSNLQQICEKNGFKLITKHRLPSIQITGLWKRITHNQSMSILMSAAIYAGMLISYPFIRYVMPSDIIYHIYQKE